MASPTAKASRKEGDNVCIGFSQALGIRRRQTFGALFSYHRVSGFVHPFLVAMFVDTPGWRA